MKILEKEFSSKGFDYKQVYRDGKYAIYEQTKKGWKLKNYEAIIIESHNGYELGGQKIPASEVYPSTTQWGVKGFTLLDYDAALEKINKLKKQIPLKRRKRRK